MNTPSLKIEFTYAVSEGETENTITIKPTGETAKRTSENFQMAFTNENTGTTHTIKVEL